MKKLLVTGASGFLGWTLSQLAQQRWQVYGAYCSHPFQLAGVTTFLLDLGDLAALELFFQTIQPDAVIHLAALSQPNLCQKNPQLSYQVNVINTINLARCCADFQIPLIFSSTDLVFDGTKPPYRESDRVNPVNIYGQHKVEAEQALAQIYPQAAICRMPLMFGLPSPFSQSFIQPFIQTLRSQQNLSLFTDEWRSPVSSITASQGLLLALEKEVNGILHLGGVESVSRYQLGCLLAEILALPTDKLTPCSQVDVLMPAARPPNVSLDSQKAYQLGYSPPSLRESLTAIAARL